MTISREKKLIGNVKEGKALANSVLRIKCGDAPREREKQVSQPRKETGRFSVSRHMGEAAAPSLNSLLQ